MPQISLCAIVTLLTWVNFTAAGYNRGTVGNTLPKYQTLVPINGKVKPYGQNNGWQAVTTTTARPSTQYGWGDQGSDDENPADYPQDAQCAAISGVCVDEETCTAAGYELNPTNAECPSTPENVRCCHASEPTQYYTDPECAKLGGTCTDQKSCTGTGVIFSPTNTECSSSPVNIRCCYQPKNQGWRPY